MKLTDLFAKREAALPAHGTPATMTGDQLAKRAQRKAIGGNRTALPSHPQATPDLYKGHVIGQRSGVLPARLPANPLGKVLPAVGALPMPSQVNAAIQDEQNATLSPMQRIQRFLLRSGGVNPDDNMI